VPAGGAQGDEAVAHGQLKRSRGRPLGVGSADGEHLTCKRGGREEVEAAVKASESKSGLKFEGGKPELEVKAGDVGEGDAESGREGFVELNLKLRTETVGEWKRPQAHHRGCRIDQGRGGP